MASSPSDQGLAPMYGAPQTPTPVVVSQVTPAAPTPAGSTSFPAVSTSFPAVSTPFLAVSTPSARRSVR